MQATHQAGPYLRRRHRPPLQLVLHRSADHVLGRWFGQHREGSR
jgi:hypothetical protein